MIHDSVLEIAQKYLTRIKRTGSENIMAVCPFHLKDGQSETTPSFTMSLTKGLYFCFACQESGNLFTFLRNVGVPRLLLERQFRPLLDQIAAFTPKKPDPLRPGVFDKNPLPESLLGLFDHCPLGLLEEGFEEELLQKYDVGFDRDHMRITFPLRDLNGNLVGISGRTVVDEFPRYKVYDKEYERWGYPFRRTDKRIVLWNADRVYPSAFFEPKARVVLVEGFKACLRLIQSGIPHTMALLGTHLSYEQQWVLERIGGEVYLMLDNNEWGQIGTARVGTKLSASLTVKVVEYPEEKPQPSDLGPTEVHEALTSAKDFYLWVTEERNRWLLARIR